MILITGAAGFIGRHLTKALSTNVEVVTLDVQPMPELGQTKSLTADIRSLTDLEKIAGSLEGLKACIHLAAVASPPIAEKDPTLAWATNVVGTHNVLKLLHKVKCRRTIFFSSAHVYGISPKYLPTDEHHPLALHDTYTTTKILGEKLCQLFYENYDMSYTALRLWNAYGPGQSPDYFLGKKISQALKGELTIRNEKVTKDWIHVSDVVNAAIASLTCEYVGPLNIGTGVETSLGDIVTSLAQHFKIGVVHENVPDEGPTRMLCNWSRAQSVLRWSPKVTFEQGLKDLVVTARKS